MTEPQQFRKRPVEIEAMRLDPDTAKPADGLSPHDEAHASIAGWMLGHGFREFRVVGAKQPFGIEILTLEGAMRAEAGDWIIRGLAGEFYPCKPDIFEQTYVPAARAVSATTPLQRLDDAVHEFVAETGGQGKDVTGWVLGTATSRVDFTDPDLLPLRTGETYALGPQTGVATAAGLARFLSITIEHHMLDANDD